MENFGEEKILQSILSSETLINYNEKRRERSSEGKYTTLTFKARLIQSANKKRAHALFLHYLPPILLPSQ